MNKCDIKIGMKVVPHKKTYGEYSERLEESTAWKIAKLDNQNYLYVTDIKCDFCVLSPTKDGIIGDYYNFSDFTNIKTERKNKLLKIINIDE